MRLKGIIDPLLKEDKFISLIDNIKKGETPVEISGISDSAKSYVVSAMYNEVDKPFLILSYSDMEARNIYEDLLFHYDNVEYFPNKEVVFYNIDAISGDLRWRRINVLKNVLSKKNNIVVASIEAVMSKYTPIDTFKGYIKKVSIGDIVDAKKTSMWLIEGGYERVVTVENKGQFSIRGGIIDIYPPTEEYPFRIELFDDEIDSIRTFNTKTQRSIEKVFTFMMYPAKEIVMPKEVLENGISRIKEDFESYKEKFKTNKEVMENINSTIGKNLEYLQEKGNCDNIESYLSYFFKETSQIYDYFDGYQVIVDDVSRCIGKLESIFVEFNENFETYFTRGSILSKQATLLYNLEHVKDEIKYRCKVAFNPLSIEDKFLNIKNKYNLEQRSLHHYHGQLDFLIDDLNKKKANGDSIIILSGTKSRGERLIDILKDKGIEAVYKDSIKELIQGQIVVTYGNQLNGMEFPKLCLCIISDKTVFGESKRKAKKHSKKGVGKIKSFTDLKLGDYVVHVNHGIGVYKGIKQLDIKGYKKDYLMITYTNSDLLYVPVEQLDMIQKYIGAEGKSPKINKLGGSEWVKAKRKVRKSIMDIADELLKLYASRSLVKGYIYNEDTPWQKQFEDEFPYEETGDQLIAIEDIKKDMESDKPMDRLLCGDVGYGKTEVAIRAAFKAVMNGKQVAFLVPTTILAKQHYSNFIQRFAGYPINIDMICRFRTTAEQKQTLLALKEGNVDIIIGTHKLIQKDVRFKDLGLLIVDEEQRFGVTHKEKIKNLKKNIDVLTLTATPIPRTLHMSLSGIRDISVIETPPEDRYPIQTYVVEFNEQLVRDAIIREIGRGGQVYFVYNRVESIKEMTAFLMDLIPEARIVIGHGQMTERELEKVMLDFMDRKYDILVSTTIIETGIDIKNVNTMIIYDADKMGLSQLYQLRGRVGRTNKVAYSYFMYKKDKLLSEVAEKRLKAIKEFTELGSGFKIAMRDLEIRGAGNLMGSSQHGHMSVVGYDLYCRMLEETIDKLKGDIEDEPIETVIDIKIDAYIPEEYISNETQKIEIYKKIAAIENEEDMEETINELEDRFSNIPKPVFNLINISSLRFLCKSIGVVELKEVKNEMLFEFKNNKYFTPKVFTKLMEKYKNKITFKVNSDVPTIAYKYSLENKDEFIEDLKGFILYLKDIN